MFEPLSTGGVCVPEGPLSQMRRASTCLGMTTVPSSVRAQLAAPNKMVQNKTDLKRMSLTISQKKYRAALALTMCLHKLAG
ncbi:hypothetical protein ACFPLB_14970 [Aquamicrobium segne]|uniref:Uncharacterized protein n=1 Tax=Aquamicrobium segne TaxID=469547 RepID=A0ABW0H009_9HYPH